MKKALFAFVSTLALPVIALAQNFNPRYIDDVVRVGKGWLGTAVTVLMILMTLWFLWSVFKFIGEKDAAKMKDRKKQMINGLIGLFIAVAVWGIIKLASNIFGFTSTTNTAPAIACPPGYIYNAVYGECRPR